MPVKEVKKNKKKIKRKEKERESVTSGYGVFYTVKCEEKPTVF